MREIPRNNAAYFMFRYCGWRYVLTGKSVALAPGAHYADMIDELDPAHPHDLVPVDRGWWEALLTRSFGQLRGKLILRAIMSPCSGKAIDIVAALLRVRRIERKHLEPDLEEWA